MTLKFCALAVALILVAGLACGGGDDGPFIPEGDGTRATLGGHTYDCDWLIDRWNFALREVVAFNPTTYEHYKPSLLILAKLMEQEANSEYPLIWGDADRALRQCDGLDNYPPWTG